MVFFQPPAAGGVVAPSSGRDVLKADPTGTGTAGLSRIVCTVTNRGSWVGDSGVRRLQQLPLGGKGRAVLQAARAAGRAASRFLPSSDGAERRHAGVLSPAAGRSFVAPHRAVGLAVPVQA